MKRAIDLALKRWKARPDRKPLLLKGARQVGKTHSIRELGKSFKQIVEINFEATPAAKSIFEKDLSAKRLVRDISLFAGKTITAGDTLLFLDEAQEMPRAITALRYLYEEMPSLHVIAAGSLLDFAIEHVGVPVGRITFLYMHPMSFMEFLIARGEKLLAQEILQHTPDNLLPAPIHKKALALLGEYFAIGGMPETVQEWVKTHDVSVCATIQQSLVNAYRQDFQKYTSKFQLEYTELLFNNIPRLSGKPIKYSHFSKEHRKRELAPCLNLLIKANVVHKVINSSGNGIPLAAESNPEKFKLIFLDIALAQTMLGLELKDWFLQTEIALANKGEMTESFIGQELLAYRNPTKQPELYYWQRETRGSQAEIDYLISHDQNIIPLEVKSGQSHSLKSLHYFLETHKQSPFGVRLSVHNYSILDHIHSYPLYALAGLFAEDKEAILDMV